MTALLCCMICVQIGATFESSCASTDPACSSSESASVLQAHTQSERQHPPRSKESMPSTIDVAPPHDKAPQDLLHHERPPPSTESQTPLTLDVIQPKIQKALKALAKGKADAGTTVVEDDDNHAVLILGPDATDSHTEKIDIIKNADPDEDGMNLVQTNGSTDALRKSSIPTWYGTSHCYKHDCNNEDWCYTDSWSGMWCYCENILDVWAFNMVHNPHSSCPGQIAHPLCYYAAIWHTKCTSARGWL